jgi:hypothetical protein
VKHQHFVSILFEDLSRVINAVGGVAKLTGYDDRLVLARRRLHFDHPANRARGARQNLA